MVVRTNDPALTAAVATACRILSLNFSDDMAVEVTSERIVAEAAMQPALEDLLTRIGNMWVPWAEMPQPHGMLDELITQFAKMAPARRPAPRTAPSELALATRVRELVAAPEDEPDWGCSEDEQVLPEVQMPIAEVPRALPAHWVRMGVDLGGVLLPKLPARQLRTIRTPEDVARLGLAREWFEECVHYCGPENVFIISYVGSPRLRDLFGRYLQGPSGLLTTTGIPPRNLVWTDSKIGKAEPFVANGLTHFVDDQVDVLTSIRAACWERGRTPPTLFLVPTRWADGTSSDFERCCSSAARAGYKVPWCIFPARSLGDVRPWHKG
jgi:hypothetical protein